MSVETYPITRYDFYLAQGSAKTIEVTYKDLADVVVDITGYTGRMQARLKASSPDPPLLDLTTANGGLVIIDAVNGRFDIVITSIQSAALDFVRAVYDVELLPGAVEADATRVLEGVITLTKEVTK